MDGFLLFLAFTGLFICIFILLNRTGSLVDNMEAMQKKLILMAKELTAIKAELHAFKTAEQTDKLQEKRAEKTESSHTPPVFISEIKTESVERSPEEKKEPFVAPVEIFATVHREEKADRPKSIPVSKPVKPKEPSFFERNPDLEKFIGENLINKIGIAILVIGIGFFVKFAIDQDWINEVGRVFIGIVCGAILVGFAHYTRNSFRSFSSVLVGGGMAIFYLTIAIAFHEYKLMPQSIAFVIMVIITIFSVILSIIYDRKELAVLALIGGFTSPFMLSTGSGNYQVLFTYVLILNIGMIVLSYFKRWNIINVISFAFTILLYGAWLIKTFTFDLEPSKAHIGAMLFASLFYLTFFTMNIINNIKENKAFLAFQLSILIVNTFLYYSAGMFILKGIHGGLYQGLFTILIATFNFIFAYVLFKNKKVDANLVYLLIGLVLTFVSLSAPIQLEGNYITLFWAAEAVLLLWLSQKSGIRIMKLGSCIITFLMVISLVMDWNNVYLINMELIPIVFNKACIASFVVIASLVSTILLLRNEKDEALWGTFNHQTYSVIVEVGLLLVTYFSGLLEVYFQFDSRSILEQTSISITPIYTGCYNLTFSLLFSIYVHYKKVKWLQIFPVVSCMTISVVYLIYYNQINFELRDSFLLDSPQLAFHYYFHYINSLLLIILLVNTLRIVQSNYVRNAREISIFFWFMCFVLIYVASSELQNSALVSSYKTGVDLYNLKHQISKVGFPILWGICSFILMILGMRFKIKTLRIISLSVFGLTLLRMFIFDIREMSEGGKIAAFISLGILLLVMSFMYQKLKKILTEE